MATLKSNNAAIAAMQKMLQERCIAEPAFAIKMANPNKSFEGAVNYLCSQIQKSGMCMVDDATVMNYLCHYFDETDVGEVGKVNCDIVVSKPELSDEDKAELKQQAMEQYREEQLRELRRQSQPKAQSKPSVTVPKAGKEINVQPSLFDI
ncbi:MAG: PcfK-like family protein [Muribaculaceae bacterium]